MTALAAAPVAPTAPVRTSSRPALAHATRVGSLFLLGLFWLLLRDDLVTQSLSAVAAWATLVTIAALVLLTYDCPRRSWALPVVSLFVLSLFHIGALPEMIFTDTSSLAANNTWLFLSNTRYAAWLAVVGLVAFAFGATLVGAGTEQVRQRERVAPPSWDPVLRARLADVGSLVTVGCVLAWFYATGTKGVGATSAYSDYLQIKSTSAFSLIYNTMGLGLGLACLEYRRFSARIALLAFTAFALVGLPIGLRGEVMFPVAAAVTVVALQRPMPRFRTTVVPMIMLLSVVSVIRGLRQTGLGNTQDAVVTASPLSGLAELGASLRVVGVIVQWRNTLGEPYDHGSTYLASVVNNVVHVVLQQARPAENANPAFLATQISNRVGPIGGSVIAEAYDNFALIGMIVIMACLGLTLRRLDGLMKRHVAVAALAVQVAFTFQLIVRNSFGPVPLQLELAVAFVLVALAWSRLRDPRQWRRSSRRRGTPVSTAPVGGVVREPAPSRARNQFRLIEPVPATTVVQSRDGAA